jgi:hypothetical protein
MLFVTLVGQYPFERPEDKGDPQKMHRMIRRIVNVDYKLPSRVDVSPQCRVRAGACTCGGARGAAWRVWRERTVEPVEDLCSLSQLGRTLRRACTGAAREASMAQLPAAPSSL